MLESYRMYDTVAIQTAVLRRFQQNLAMLQKKVKMFDSELQHFRKSTKYDLHSLALRRDSSSPPISRMCSEVFSAKIEIAKRTVLRINKRQVKAKCLNTEEKSVMTAGLKELVSLVSDGSDLFVSESKLKVFIHSVGALQQCRSEKRFLAQECEKYEVLLSIMQILSSFSLDKTQQGCLHDFLAQGTAKTSSTVEKTSSLSQLESEFTEILSSHRLKLQRLNARLGRLRGDVQKWQNSLSTSSNSEVGPFLLQKSENLDMFGSVFSNILTQLIRRSCPCHESKTPDHPDSVINTNITTASSVQIQRSEQGNCNVEVNMRVEVNVQHQSKSNFKFEENFNSLLVKLRQFHDVAMQFKEDFFFTEPQDQVMMGSDILDDGKVAAIVKGLLSFAAFPYFSVHVKTVKGVETVLNIVPRTKPLMLGNLERCSSQCSGVPKTNAKSENQSHTLVFARGEVLQTIDMNQTFYFEEGFKMRLFLEQFQFCKSSDFPRYTLVGCPETIFTKNIGSIGRFMAMQDMSFVTIVQRVLNYTGMRLHYGHPDIIDGFWCRFHAGLSKASPEVNLSEDLFFGLDNLSRGGKTNFVEFILFGKGREVGLDTCSVFEDKIARGAAMALKSPDLYRLNRWLDGMSCFSLMFGSIGHYLFTMFFDYAITSFIWM
mmetsp:Transcript_18823/g.36847  ORF Transcript_18823/g.36847 Transcript_18823/m.36847 type:complete len:657 (-) Transcript_18823:1984-3954(-)